MKIFVTIGECSRTQYVYGWPEKKMATHTFQVMS